MDNNEVNVNNAGNRGRKPLFIAIAVIAVLLVGGIAAAALSGKLGGGVQTIKNKDAKTIVIDALTGKAGEKEKSAFETMFNLDNSAEGEPESGEAGLLLTIDGAKGIPELDAMAGSEISLDFYHDVKTEVSAMNLGLGVGGLKLLNSNFYLDKEFIYFAFPDYSTKKFSIDYTNNLKERFKNSFIGQASGLDTQIDSYLAQIDEAINSAVNDDSEKEDLTNEMISVFDNYLETTKAFTNLKDSITVKEIASKKFTVNQTEKDYNGYEVLVPKKSIIELLEVTNNYAVTNEKVKEVFLALVKRGMSSSMDAADADMATNELWRMMEEDFPAFLKELETMMSDVTMNVYVDETGRLIAMDAATAITEEEESIDVKFIMEKSGGYTLNDNIKAELIFEDKTNEANKAFFKFDKIGNSDDKKLDSTIKVSFEDLTEKFLEFNMYGRYDSENTEYVVGMDMSTSGEVVFNVTANGKIEKNEKAGYGTIHLDNLSIEADGQDLIDLSGNVYIKPLSKEITPPDGEEFNLIDATEEDYNVLVLEVYQKLAPIIEAFGSY